MRRLEWLLRLFRGRLTDRRVESVLRLIPAAIYFAVIFSVSSIPGQEIHVAVNDKVLHFFEYFFLSVAILLAAIGFGPSETRPGHYVATWLVGALYGISDEFHQRFVPARDSSIFDWFADVLGISLALAVVYALTMSKRRRQ